MSGNKKIRADLLLMRKGLAESRHQAAALILSGRVWTPVGRVQKGGDLMNSEEKIMIEAGDLFVSRGGIKLSAALDHFRMDPRGLVCLDSGASTGGFTDCLLQRGAGKVYAIDVGYGQFHPKLRADPRIVLMEKTNIRHLSDLPEKMDLAVLDLSFISLTNVLEKIRTFMKEGGEILALVKPQFELGPKGVKKGVVRDEALRERAVKRIIDHAEGLGMRVLGSVPSPLAGPKGNREFFVRLRVF